MAVRIFHCVNRSSLQVSVKYGIKQHTIMLTLGNWFVYPDILQKGFVPVTDILGRIRRKGHNVDTLNPRSHMGIIVYLTVLIDR